MRKIFLRIFFAFWSAMVLVIAFTFLATVWLADQRQQHELARQEELARQASAVLADQGVSGLRGWLQVESMRVAPDTLIVLDDHGLDLLGRHVPPFLSAGAGRRPPPRTDLHRFLLFSQLVAPDGRTYSMALMHPLRHRPFGLLNLSETPLILGIGTLLVSAILCFTLARYLADPIRHLRAATRAIAQGDLGVRVAGLLGRRHDELALLAVDFDLMADRLRSLLDSQRQLLRDVSHELRSPLARLQIALGLARRPHADLERELDRIEREAQRLDELIGEILKLSRLEDPEHALERETLPLPELLESLADNARVEAEPRRIGVELQIAEPLDIRGDRELLFRAIENVLRNAVRFSPDASTVQLGARRLGAQVQLSIRDQGSGVPPELLARIFEPFYRVGNARDRDSGGHGIGLAITARVAALHGGSVEARNLSPRGFEVLITLPLQPPAARQG